MFVHPTGPPASGCPTLPPPQVGSESPDVSPAQLKAMWGAVQVGAGGWGARVVASHPLQIDSRHPAAREMQSDTWAVRRP